MLSTVIVVDVTPKHPHTRNGPDMAPSLQLPRVRASEETPPSEKSVVGPQVGTMVMDTWASQPPGSPDELSWAGR